jgi:hypothetical protein
MWNLRFCSRDWFSLKEPKVPNSKSLNVLKSFKDDEIIVSHKRIDIFETHQRSISKKDLISDPYSDVSRMFEILCHSQSLKVNFGSLNLLMAENVSIVNEKLQKKFGRIGYFTRYIHRKTMIRAAIQKSKYWDQNWSVSLFKNTEDTKPFFTFNCSDELN